jgi:hypothetical protein
MIVPRSTPQGLERWNGWTLRPSQGLQGGQDRRRMPIDREARPG